MSLPDVRPTLRRWEAILLAVAFGLCYGPVFVQFLIPRWLTDEAATHGWLVIPIAATVAWSRRAVLARLPRVRHQGGLVLVALALSAHVAEKLLDLNGPSPASIPLYIAGVVWYLCGGAWLRELAFPIAYLWFMVPVPGGLTQAVSFPLRLLASEGSRWIAGKFGVAIYGAGMNVEFMQPRGTEYVRILVADPCSGLHSLMAIKALHAITAYVSRLRIGWKWVLFLCALPITLAANVCRMTLIILVCAYVDKDFGLKVFHDWSPYVLFAFVFAILIGIGRFFEWATGGAAVQADRRAREDALLAGEVARHSGPLPRPLALAAVTAAVGIGAFWFGLRPPARAIPADVTRVPRSVGAWRAVADIPDDPTTLKQIEADSHIHRRYVRSDGQVVDFMVVYRRYGRREFAHRPDQCYPAGGFVGVRQDMTTVPWAGRMDPAVHWLFDGRNVLRGDGGTGVPMTTVTYLFVSGNRSESNFMKQQLWMALERLMPNKNGWTFLRLSSPRVTTDAEALAAQQDFLRAFEGPVRSVITTDSATAGRVGG
ncbi:MAG: exosortase C-terminal domain/associated protein EpsI [Armatimonadota bacterium]